jgi:hypothetical protein
MKLKELHEAARLAKNPSEINTIYGAVKMTNVVRALELRVEKLEDEARNLKKVLSHGFSRQNKTVQRNTAQPVQEEVKKPNKKVNILHEDSI